MIFMMNPIISAFSYSFYFFFHLEKRQQLDMADADAEVNNTLVQDTSSRSLAFTHIVLPVTFYFN